MNNTSVSIYLATPITGKTGKEIWDSNIPLINMYNKKGVKVNTSLMGDDIPYTDKKVVKDKSDDEMVHYWKEKDKRLIRESNVFVYEPTERVSQGITDEYRFARGTLFKPCVGIYSKIPAGFIMREENDYVARSHEEAALVIKARWGTWPKRVWWRLKMLNRSLPRFVCDHIKEFFR